MMMKLLLALIALLCVTGLPTAKGQDVRVDIQRLLQIAEDIDENVDALEEEMSDVADEIEDMDDEIEDFGEEIEDMEAGVGAIATETERVQEEVKTMRNVLETGLEEIREKVESETDIVKNDTQDIKEEVKRLEEKVSEDMTKLQDSIQTLNKDITGNHVEVTEDLARLQDTTDILGTCNNLTTTVEGLEQSTLILVNHTEKELRDMKEHVGSKVDSLEGELREVTDNQLEVREELAGLQRDMNSTLYLLQELRSQLVNLRQENSAYHFASSCRELQSYSLSGYYQLRNSSTRVYCDMDRQSCKCGSTQGWMRVANIDMTDPNQQCPDGFRLRPDTTKRMCEMTRETRGCTSIVFPTHSVQYSRVCGKIQAYQYAVVVAFYSYYDHRSITVDDIYVDGVSVTHGQSPRNHIWTFAAAVAEQSSSSWTCPCTRTTTTYTGEVPPFIGNDYFCDTGSRQGWEYRLYTEDPLWDGQGCGNTSSCCQFNSPPWFCKELPQPTTDDIEVRVCRYINQRYPYQPNTPFDVIELYVQ